MKRNEIVQIEEQKIRDAVHARDLFKTLPVNTFLTIEYFLSHNSSSSGKILSKIKTMRNSFVSDGYVILNILAANTNTSFFEIGSGPEAYKMTPNKIRRWERVSKKDLPLFLGWPKRYPEFARFLRKF